MNDIGLISRPIYAPSHDLENTDNTSNTPPTTLVSTRILVELLGIREGSVTLYDCLVCTMRGCIPASHPYRITSTKCRINTFLSLDDGHIVARNM